MRGRKSSWKVELSDSQRSELDRWLRSTRLAAGLARRARVVLLVAEGQHFSQAARTCGLTIRNARKWVRRYLDQGLEGLKDKTGRGRKPVFSPRGSDSPRQDRLRAAG